MFGIETWSLAATLHGFIWFGVLLRVVSRRLYPGSALAWLLLVASVPYGGLVLYVLIGERPLGRRRMARLLALYPPGHPWLAPPANAPTDKPPTLTPAQNNLARLAAQVLDAPVEGGGRIALFAGAEPALTALARDIDAARRHCHLAFYIWQAGGQADEVGDALIRAAGRGIACRILLDAVGSAAFLRGPWPARLRTAGIEVKPALPVGLLRALFVRMDLRLHRKIAVIDGRVAYTGSLNLIDPHQFRQQAGVGEWVDAMARVEGPPAGALDRIFRRDWVAEGGQFPGPSATVTGDRFEAGGAAMHVAPSGPDFPQDNLRRLLLTALYEAHRELVITTPYFVPDEAVVLALESAAQRGVRVTLIVPARVDSRLVRHASRSFFDDLMSAGVRICQFHGGLLHTKSITVDGEITLFGSSNLDIRSLRLNFEVTLIAYDAPFTAAVRRLQADYEANSEVLDLARWRSRSRARRFVENLLRLASPLL
ncbi:MAG: cardiolipin synthase [Zoogloeaceae bacterium]|nr:cardiolipin synthase [Zoogloeaceae bacterium]